MQIFSLYFFVLQPSSKSIPVRPSIQDFLGHFDEDDDPKDSLDGLNYQDNQLNADKSLLEFLSSDTPRSDFSSARTYDQDRAGDVGENENQLLKTHSKEKASEIFTKPSLGNPSMRNALLSGQNLSSKKHSSENNKTQYKNRQTKTTKIGDKDIIAEEEKAKAAQLIQIWWRRTRIRRTAGAAAMKRMMERKQTEIKQRLTIERERVCGQENFITIHN